MPSEIDLPAKNGLDMGNILQWKVTCWDITACIAEEMRGKLVSVHR